MKYYTFNPNESFWAVLGIMRFLLATIVYFVHLKPFVQLPVPLLFEQVILFGGKTAVIGFLVISGVSIGYSYRKAKEGYWKRRFLRIYPLYFFAVLLTVLLQHFLGSPYPVQNWTLNAAGWLTNVANFFFLQEFVSITITYNIALWSLSIEVFFYLLVPFLFKLPVQLLYLMVVSSMFFFTFFHFNILYGYSALVFAWPWLIGFLLSAKQERISIILFLIAGLVIVGTNTTITGEKLSWLTFLIVALILIYSTVAVELPPAVVKIFNYLGELSYPIYVFHLPVYLILSHIGVRNVWLYCLLMLLSIVPINHVFDHWLKKVFWKPLVERIDKGFTIYHIAVNKR